MTIFFEVIYGFALAGLCIGFVLAMLADLYYFWVMNHGTRSRHK